MLNFYKKVQFCKIDQFDQSIRQIVIKNTRAQKILGIIRVAC